MGVHTAARNSALQSWGSPSERTVAGVHQGRFPAEGGQGGPLTRAREVARASGAPSAQAVQPQERSRAPSRGRRPAPCPAPGTRASGGCQHPAHSGATRNGRGAQRGEVTPPRPHSQWAAEVKATWASPGRPLPPCVLSPQGPERRPLLIPWPITPNTMAATQGPPRKPSLPKARKCAQNPVLRGCPSQSTCRRAASPRTGPGGGTGRTVSGCQRVTPGLQRWAGTATQSLKPRAPHVLLRCHDPHLPPAPSTGDTLLSPVHSWASTQAPAPYGSRLGPVPLGQVPATDSHRTSWPFWVFLGRRLG